MSRTDVHRPAWIQLADPHNRHLVYRYAAWPHEMAPTTWKNICCGCRMCTSHYWRKQERRRDRHSWRRDPLNYQ